MYEAFERLKEEKRQAVLGAAMDEFAARGWLLASTNEIVKGAGISKGALFHYFGDKKGLYLYLCGYVADILEREYFTPLRGLGGDLIVRLGEAVALKMKLLARYPRLFAFAASLLAETAPEVREESRAFQGNAMETQHRALFEGLDGDLIRADIPPEQANKMLWWILEGYSNELSALVAGKPVEEIDMQGEIQRFEQFKILLKQIFYRQGGNQS